MSKTPSSHQGKDQDYSYVIGNLLLAEKYNLVNLRGHCISEAKHVALPVLKAHPDFSKIKQPILIELLMSRIEKLEKGVRLY